MSVGLNGVLRSTAPFARPSARVQHSNIAAAPEATETDLQQEAEVAGVDGRELAAGVSSEEIAAGIGEARGVESMGTTVSGEVEVDTEAETAATFVGEMIFTIAAGGGRGRGRGADGVLVGGMARRLKVILILWVWVGDRLVMTF